MPLITGHVVGMAEHKSNPLMPLINQMACHVIRCLHIIHEDGGGQRMVGSRRNADKTDAAPFQFSQDIWRIGDGGGENDAINMCFIN